MFLRNLQGEAPQKQNQTKPKTVRLSYQLILVLSKNKKGSAGVAQFHLHLPTSAKTVLIRCSYILCFTTVLLHWLLPLRDRYNLNLNGEARLSDANWTAQPSQSSLPCKFMPASINKITISLALMKTVQQSSRKQFQVYTGTHQS